MWEVPRSGKRNWGTMEIKSKSCSSGGWGFGSQKLKAYFIEADEVIIINDIDNHNSNNNINNYNNDNAAVKWCWFP